MSPEVKCAVCGKALTPYDTKVKDGGKSYCPMCYFNYWRNRPDGAEAAATEANEEAKCSSCGKAMAPKDVRVLYANGRFCLACYDRSAPYLEIKGLGPGLGDAIAAMRTGKRIACEKCKRDLGPLDVRVSDGGAIYCESCYAKNRGKVEEKRFYVAEKAGLNMRPGVTSLRNADDLVECFNCGWIITRDRLATFPKDARGKVRCPNCGKRLASAGTPAPAKPKPEKPKPEKMGTEDFAVTAQLFKCLGDPCRVKIIESLSEKELCVFEFVDLTGFQYSAISYHLKMLKDMGVIRSYERGNFMVYSLTDKGRIVHEFIEKSKGLG